MPHLQLSDATASKAHLAAVFGSNLQQAYGNAVARANKVAAREPHIVTAFALGDEIETIEQEATAAGLRLDTETYLALTAVATRLKALIPTR